MVSALRCCPDCGAGATCWTHWPTRSIKGNFIGGALVIDGSFHAGHTGNAVAFGTLPVTDERASGRLVQFIDTASVHLLESTAQCQDALKGGYLDYDSVFWSSGAAAINAWIDRTSTSLAIAITSVSSVSDVGAIILDGGFPGHIRDRIVESTIHALQQVNTRGIILPVIRAGIIGPGARALGAARLPLFSRFLLDQSVLTIGRNEQAVATRVFLRKATAVIPPEIRPRNQAQNSGPKLRPLAQA